MANILSALQTFKILPTLARAIETKKRRKTKKIISRKKLSSFEECWRKELLFVFIHLGMFPPQTRDGSRRRKQNCFNLRSAGDGNLWSFYGYVLHFERIIHVINYFPSRDTLLRLKVKSVGDVLMCNDFHHNRCVVISVSSVSVTSELLIYNDAKLLLSR